MLVLIIIFILFLSIAFSNPEDGWFVRIINKIENKMKEKEAKKFPVFAEKVKDFNKKFKSHHEMGMLVRQAKKELDKLLKKKDYIPMEEMEAFNKQLETHKRLYFLVETDYEKSSEKLAQERDTLNEARQRLKIKWL